MRAVSRVICGLFAAVGVLALAGPARAASTGVTAWGDNENGQLGDGVVGEADDSPVAVAGVSGVTAVTAGDEHSMALLGGGTVVAWGNNAHGQLGDGEQPDSAVPVDVMGLSEVRAISAGGAHSLALLGNGDVMAWGDNHSGQLGDGGETDSDVPVKVSGLSGVKSISAGGAHSLALLSDGEVMAWGWNGFGQLGNGSFTNSDVPVAVRGLSEVAAVAAGEAHSLALLKNGTVMAWGSNTYGELGDGGKTESDVPVQVTGLSEVAAIAGGGSHSLALLKDGKVMAWGDNEHGQLGDGSEEQSSDVPVEVKGLSEVTAIAAGGSHSLALLKNGTVMVWGNDSYGQLGDGSYERASDVPVEVAGLSEVTAIAGGHLHSLAASSPPKPFPTLSSVDPGYGAPAGGTHVTIRGTNFNEVAAVKFGSANAESFKVESETEIAAVAPVGTGTVHVRVTTTKGGNSPTGFPGEFDYRPAVTNLEPGYGAPVGGSHVIITGANFNEVAAVKFGSSNAVSFKVESETTIAAVAPAGTGTVEVTVTTAGGASPTGLANGFSYAPSVTKLEPGYGSPAGGTHVTITGTNFNEVNAVKFGSSNAVSFKVESETTIAAVAPAGTGVVEVTITSAGGVSTSAPSYGFGARPDEFSYAPVVTGVGPGHGAPAGETEVTITGGNFTGATAVKFGANDATSFTVESDTKITAVTPAFSGGEEDGVGVYVTAPGGTNISEECGYPVGYRYEPTITRVEPDSGPLGGGTHVTIRGAAFEGVKAEGGLLCSLLWPVVQSVKFGSKAATHWNIISDTEITAVAPAGSGTADVTIDSVVGTSPIIAADQFSYFPATQEPKTEAATALTSTSAILEGTLAPAATRLKYDFEYNAGASCAGGTTTPEAEGEDRVSTTVERLTPNTEYTFCLVAKSAKGGTVVGRADTFRSLESRAERETKEKEEVLKKLIEEHAKQVAEEAAAEEAVAKKHQEEEAAAAKKKNEEAAATGSVSLAGSMITVHRNGEAQVKLTCTGTVTCEGKLILTVKKTNGKGSRKAKAETIGTATFSMLWGTTATVKLTLNPAGRALVETGRGRLSATLTVLKSSPVPSQTHTENVHLVREKSRRIARR